MIMGFFKKCQKLEFVTRSIEPDEILLKAKEVCGRWGVSNVCNSREEGLQGRGSLSIPPL